MSRAGQFAAKATPAARNSEVSQRRRFRRGTGSSTCTRFGAERERPVTETVSGTPQGGVISPLLSNVYLHFLDSVWERQCADVGVLVRYADDFVVLCRTATSLGEAERRVRIIFERLRLDLHPEKTRRVVLTNGKEGFDFLGCHHRKLVSIPLLLTKREKR